MKEPEYFTLQPHLGSWEVHITLILSQLYFYMLCAKKHILLICYACFKCHATAINIKVLAQSGVVLLTCIYMQTDRDTRE